MHVFHIEQYFSKLSFRIFSSGVIMLFLLEIGKCI